MKPTRLKPSHCRVWVVGATALTLALGGSVAMGATTSTLAGQAFGWMTAGDTAPPYLGAPRNLHLDATPQAPCGPGSMPETSWQGRVPAKDVADGRAAKGYTCNTQSVSHFGNAGGFRVARYVDANSHTCAFYDSTATSDVPASQPAGTYVLDMADPAKPVMTTNLMTPAMTFPHESLRLNAARGLLVAGTGSAATNAGFVDVYNVKDDCRHPTLLSSLPLGITGHESGFSPDGRTFWVSATATQGITAIDLSNPSVPDIIWRTNSYGSHGIAISADGRRAYLSSPCCNYATAVAGIGPDSRTGGLIILDVSKVQNRTLASPFDELPELSRLTWPEISIPQNAIPITVTGRRYIIEFDEFSSNNVQYDPGAAVGAARVIDINDETQPKVISHIRLAVHNTQERQSEQQGDPGAGTGVSGYSSHYCAVPRLADPGILACSMILSGLRVFDIRDPFHPREVAYFNRPPAGGSNALSAPAFDPARGNIWYTDGASGFWNVHLTGPAWPRTGAYPTPNF